MEATLVHPGTTAFHERSPRMRPLHRMLLAIATGVLCGALLSSAALIRIAGPEDAVDELNRVEPSDSALADVFAALSRSSENVRSAFSATEGGQRTELMLAAAVDSDEATRAWSSYLETSLSLEGEAELQAIYESIAVEQTNTVVLALNSPPIEPAAILALNTTISQMNRDRLEAIDSIRDLYARRTADLLDASSGGIDNLRASIIVMFALLVLLWTPLAYLLLRGAQEEEAMLRRIIGERHGEARHAVLESQVQRALEMARTEDAAYRVVAEAIRSCTSEDKRGEFLVADSSRAHFRQVSATGGGGEGPGCPVGGPGDCPATNSGQTHVFSSASQLDACPHLRDRAHGSCSAVCVPVGIAGRTIGVLHVTGVENDPLPESAVQDLELISRKAGDRIGMLRAFARTESEARTDPLTGLLNRRSLENQARRLVEQNTPYAIAFADLDHFKDLNTRHGHETGDRALRTFSRTMRDSIRPDDIPARWGGEEFVVLLPDCSRQDAVVVAERLRERLAWVLDRGDLPQFTVSIGVAVSEPGSEFKDVVARADECLLLAKDQGRDRVVAYESATDDFEQGHRESMVPVPKAESSPDLAA